MLSLLPFLSGRNRRNSLLTAFWTIGLVLVCLAFFPYTATAALVGDPFALPVLESAAADPEPSLGQSHAAVKSDTTLAGDPFSLPTGEGPGTDLSDARNSQNSDSGADAGAQLQSLPAFSFGGHAESRNQFSLRKADTPISLRQRLHMEGSARWENLSFFGSARAEYDFAARTWNNQPHRAFRASPHEAYLTLDTDHLDIFAGRKIHRWGTGDGINPMDLINPTDTRDPFASGRADNRIPSTLLSITGHMKGWSLEGVFLPLAPVSDIPRRGNPWNGDVLDSLLKADEDHLVNLNHDKPKQWFRQPAFGGRLSTHQNGWDLAVLFFSGYTGTPVWHPSDTGSAIPGYTAKHPHFTAYGANFARGVGAASTIRGEIAFKPEYTMNLSGEFSPYTGDYWQGVLGWDYDLDGKYYLNFQAFGNVLSNASNGHRSKTRTWHGLAYEVSGKWLRDDLKAGVRGRAYTSEDGAVTEVFAEYSIGDHWKILSGIMFWTGPSSGSMGRFSDNDMIYGTVRYSF